MGPCLAGICNYSVWAECLAFRGHIPISPLQPPGEAQLPAPSTGEGWSQGANMFVPVIHSFVLSLKVYHPPTPPPKAKMKLFADAGIDKHLSFGFLTRSQLAFSLLQMLQQIWQAFVFPFHLMQCKPGVTWCMGQGNCPLVSAPVKTKLKVLPLWEEAAQQFQYASQQCVIVLRRLLLYCQHPEQTKDVNKSKHIYLVLCLEKMGLELTLLEWDGKPFISSVFVLLALDHAPS